MFHDYSLNVNWNFFENFVDLVQNYEKLPKIVDINLNFENVSELFGKCR